MLDPRIKNFPPVGYIKALSNQPWRVGGLVLKIAKSSAKSRGVYSQRIKPFKVPLSCELDSLDRYKYVILIPYSLVPDAAKQKAVETQRDKVSVGGR